MKKLMMMLALMAMVTVGVAQNQEGKGPHGPSPEKRIEKATAELSLTEEQVAEWKAIHQKYEDELKAIREKMQSTRIQMKGELEATLTPEQMEKFKAMQEENRQRVKQNRKGQGKGNGKNKGNGGNP